MNYELLSIEKKRIIFDLATKAICLRPSLAAFSPNKELSGKAVDFARVLAESIAEPAGKGR